MRSCLICDDHALMREALVNMVALRWPAVTVFEAGDFPSAWALAARQPDLFLVDLEMPGADPRAGVEGIRRAAPGSPLLVITGSQDDGLLVDLIKLGVAGFAMKQSTKPVLLAAIDLVLAGERYLPARFAELQRETAQAAGRGSDLLTPRQLEIVRLLAQGRSNKDIARALAVSPATIKTHVAQILAVTGAVNRTEASSRAQALGLLALP